MSVEAAQGKWLRVVRWVAVAALIGLLAALPLTVIAAVKAKEPAASSYALSNLAAIAMCIVAIAIPCKRYRRS
jgi:TRAP-type C4-dicarboxylate transport system permease small subunit